MTSLGERLSRFGKEFRRRRVGRVTLAYLAGSWLLIEVSSEVFPALAFPDWAARLVVIVALAGLPVVVFVAWVFDLTPQGVIRTAALPRARSPNRNKLRHVVGRDPVLGQLESTWESIASGQGQFVGVAGEAGLGKSTVVDAFLERVREGDADCLVGVGRSSERHGETSAYMPVIEALSEIVNMDDTGDVAREMARCAPTWYGLVFPGQDDGDDVSGYRANSQSRMQHELGVLLGQVCAERAVVICFEDFHWADVSTLDALVYLADRLDGLRLFLLVSYRESELQHSDHPFLSARLGLQSHGTFRELQLQPWDARQVEALIGAEFPDNRFPPELPARIFERTGGHPLFVVELLRYLKDASAIRQEGDGWVLTRRVDEITDDLPDSVRSMIERKMARIGEEDRRLLGAAAVQGQNFDSAVLARVLEWDAEEVEERLEQVERVFTVVELVDERDMPDGTLSSRYRFAHILYHDYFLAQLRPSRKVRWASVTADTLGAFHEQNLGEVAAELAHLFATAREYDKAATQYLGAASKSAAVFAWRESAAMARSGLDVLGSAPPSAGHDRLELPLELALGRSLCMTQGYSSHETMSCFERALELTRGMADGEQNLDLLWSLWMAYTNTGNRAKSLALSDRLQAMARDTSDPLTIAAAHLAAGFANEIAGNFPEAREHFQAVIDIEPAETSHERASRFVADPLILARGNQLRLLALMGYTEESRARWEKNLALANGGTLDPRSTVGLLIEGAWYHAFHHRFDQALELAGRTIEICNRYDFFMELQWATFLQAWATTRTGDGARALSDIAGFIGFIDTTGALMHAPLYYAVYAEVLRDLDRADEATRWIKRALEVIEHTGQGYFASEVYRLQGEMAAEEQPLAALTSLQKAHRIAREQDARLLELRAALSLDTLMRGTDAQAEGRAVLEKTLERMHPGFAADELERARESLQAAS